MKHDQIACLKRVPVFKDLPENILKQLTKVSTHLVHYKKGEIIQSPNKNPGLVAIDKGQVKVYTLSSTGKEKVLYIASDGSIYGQYQLFSGQRISSYVEATKDTWVCLINHEEFQNFLKKFPVVTIDLLNSVGTKLIDFEINASRRDLLKSKDRIYAYLQDWSLAARNSTFTLPIKKNEFASLLGITPETLSRQLKQLCDTGKILVKANIITILN